MIHSLLGEIMSLLNSTMSTLQAAADPIYYSHLVRYLFALRFTALLILYYVSMLKQATIDLLHTIHLKCRVGEDLLKGIHRAKNRFLWQNAVTRSGRPLFADSAITMRVQAFHGAKQVHRNVPGNTLYPFFKDLPILYGGYTDVRDIGKFSYNYAYEGLLTILYLNCEAASSMMRVPSLLLEDNEDSDMESGVIPYKELFEADEVDIATKRRRYGNHEESGSKYPRPLLKKIGRTSNRLRMWTIAAHEAGFFKTFDPVKADEQIELMLCKFYDECLGGTPDYSPKFRKNYGIKGPPRCYRLMKDLEEGRKKILVENWQGLMSKILKTTCKVGFSSQE
jgi:tyrosinase